MFVIVSFFTDFLFDFVHYAKLANHWSLSAYLHILLSFVCFSVFAECLLSIVVYQLDS